MGLLGKLAFWRKEEGPALPKDLGAGLGEHEMGTPGDEHLGLPGSGELPPLGGNKDDLGMSSSTGLPPFGGKKDDLEIPSASPESPAFAAPRLEEAKPEPFSPAAVPQPVQGEASGKDLEIISLKLDSLKSTLESINERLAKLEKMAEGGEESHHERKF